MRYGLIVTGGDPRTQADLAAAAEVAGWDGVFTYDAIAIGEAEMYDPWVILAAMAMRTEHIRLGAMVFAATRRRPWKLAREAATLDRLSGGRLVLPVGLGALDDQGFGNVGEATETSVRAARLDETLAILDGLWSGEPFGFEGDHFRFAPMTFRPTPVQRPRVPIWVVGAWPHARSMRRAARWDGIVVQATSAEGGPAGHEVLPEIVGWLGGIRAREGLSSPFEIVVDGTTPADAPAAAAETAGRHAEAGATWWIESDWTTTDTDALRRRIDAGPPRP
ncbi:MAG TPA: LLM class flavin-dependent oxidoreductase [Candidatus Limnocylindrales bacterium]|nr:LLM class flavin-dependent oxidoreductase [Candidatus Limnocylindrales bacterium]